MTNNISMGRELTGMRHADKKAFIFVFLLSGYFVWMTKNKSLKFMVVVWETNAIRKVL